MRITGGFTSYGQLVGVLMLETRFPRLPGDIGNAATFDFPVRYKVIAGAHPERIMGSRPDPRLLEPFVQGAKELESEGVRAITTSCGFLAPFQETLAAAVRVPVLTSSLLLVPLVRRLIHPERSIGIFTERARYMTEDHFRGAGWSSRDIPVIVQGMPETAVFPSIFIGNQLEADSDILAREVAEMTDAFIQAHPRAGAIILEVTNMAPFSRLIRERSGLPVFDINSLIRMVAGGVEPPRYGQT